MAQAPNTHVYSAYIADHGIPDTDVQTSYTGIPMMHHDIVMYNVMVHHQFTT